MILEALEWADGPLSASELHRRVEIRLGREISRHTVTSFLSVACRAEDWPVVRVGRAMYSIAR